MKYPNVTMGEYEALLDRLGGEKQARKILKGELIVVPSCWHEQEGLIYTTVKSNGLKGHSLQDFLIRGLKTDICLVAKELFNSPLFVPTSGIQYEVVIIKGDVFFDDSDRTYLDVQAQAAKLNLIEPTPEIAPLLRARLTDEMIKDMGLQWIILMHKPFTLGLCCRTPSFLAVGFDEQTHDGHEPTFRNGITTMRTDDKSCWGSNIGYAFVRPQPWQWR